MDYGGRGLFVIVLVLVLAAAAAAQTGSVAGRVVDQTEALLPGVSIELLPTGADEHAEVLTEGDGTYRFDNVPPGPAEIVFRLINFSTIRRDLVVTAGER